MSPFIPERCLFTGCFRPAVNKGRCDLPEHKPKAFYGNFRNESLPQDWRQKRQFVLRRDNFICYLCGGPGADSVDHVNDRNDHSYENLKAAHQNVEPYCHRSKTSQEGLEARKKNQAKQWGSSLAERIRKEYGLE